MNDTLLSLKEAAELLGCSTKTIRIYVDRTKRGKPGGVQYCQIAGRGPVRFRREWIRDFVDANSVAPPASSIREVILPKKAGKQYF